eukprot:TRINITY_DN8186_c0_g1_i1.p1 TRINITY_DN8186_c0_g1~~TRINITY_DN8186_c0_g1_i1.p1  ORF type:complete len:303 (+),score=32.94 TRINITY_DN8186_c0_g1_i1:47-910(+)
MEEHLRSRLRAVLARPENAECADCHNKNPEWASANLGTFICIHCSGIHRSIGVDITFVQSILLDTWKENRVEFMEEWGNQRANKIWEASVPSSQKRPAAGDDLECRQQWIRDKYIQGSFMPPPGSIELPEHVSAILEAGKSRRNSAVAALPLSTSKVATQVYTGILFVKLIRGKNLIAADIGGKSDPYCIVKIGNQIRKTTVRMTTLNPLWDELLTFNLAIPLAQTVIEVTVMDWDRMKEDDFIGDLQLNGVPAEVGDGSEHQYWFELHGVDHGEILFSLQYEALDK